MEAAVLDRTEVREWLAASVREVFGGGGMER